VIIRVPVRKGFWRVGIELMAELKKGAFDFDFVEGSSKLRDGKL